MHAIHTRTETRLIFVFVLLGTIALANSRAADVAYYVVAKGQEYNQFSTAAPAPKGNPFRFTALVSLTATNTATNATVQYLPGGAVKVLTLSVGGTPGVSNLFSFHDKFGTQAALDAAYSNGNYQVTMDTVHDGVKSPTVAVTGNAYPAAIPYVTNFAAAQAIDPASPFTLSWAPFTGAGVNDFIQLTLGDFNGNPLLQTPGPGQPGALHASTTNFVIAANTLPGGMTNFAQLLFAKGVSLNTGGYPGVSGFGSYYTLTMFTLLTLAQDVAAYNIAKQQFFNQNGTGAPVLAGGTPFRFIAQVIATASNAVNNAQIAAPVPGGTNPLTPDPTDTTFAFQQRFATEAAMDAAFLGGIYTFQFGTTHDGFRSLQLNLPADSFPVVPHITDWTPAQSINPAADFNLTWDAFSGATAFDDIVLSATDNAGNQIVFANLPSAAVSFDFPAGTFQSGQSYQAQLQFRHFTTVDTNSYPGAGGSARFVSRTTINLATTAGPPPSLAVVSTNGSTPFQLRLSGQSGLLYAIDASTNLAGGTWVPLVTNTAVGGQFIYSDPQSSGFPRRFYRGRAAN